MKTLLKLTGLFIFLFAGCTLDQGMDELNAPALIKSKDQVTLQVQEPKTVTLPWKCEFACDRDTTMAPYLCNPAQANIYIGGGGWVKGNATHIGKVNQAESHWITTACNFNPVLMQITSSHAGKITGANGDYFFYYGTTVTQLPAGTFEGDIVIDGGTGKFEGATGNVHMIGAADLTNGAMSWTGTGTITLVVGKR